MQRASAWQALPPELLVGIFENLSFYDKLTVERTCKSWRSVMQHPLVLPSLFRPCRKAQQFDWPSLQAVLTGLFGRASRFGRTSSFHCTSCQSFDPTLRLL